MTGPQTTSAKMALGPLLNGIIDFDWWMPAPKLQFDGVMDLIKRYQARAEQEKTDPLGYYLVPWAYADMQVLGQAIEGAKSLDQDKVADYIRSNTFKTVVGDVEIPARRANGRVRGCSPCSFATSPARRSTSSKTARASSSSRLRRVQGDRSGAAIHRFQALS